MTNKTKALLTTIGIIIIIPFAIMLLSYILANYIVYILLIIFGIVILGVIYKIYLSLIRYYDDKDYQAEYERRVGIRQNKKE